MRVLAIGAGEYTTGYVGGQASDSDKGAGVVGITLFDLRRRGIIKEVAISATQGTKFPGIREHLKVKIGDVYKNMDIQFDSYPADDVVKDYEAYKSALESLSPGDVVLIFTPDDTHFQIAKDAVDLGCHVLIAKPIVKTLAEHQELMDLAAAKGVYVAMEVHKRWDPIYQDARQRITQLGDFSHITAYMSQPKHQLDTFRAWAGKSSDISYYLNAHHVDFHNWSQENKARPVRVYATASTGVAHEKDIPTEDLISLHVTWENLDTGNLGNATYTSAWIAPKAEVHSQQQFFYMGHKGEVRVDQAHRGYTVSTDKAGYSSPNPLFMRYTPDVQGYFAGQNGYGYKSIEVFIETAKALNSNTMSMDEARLQHAAIQDIVPVTAILEAGRISLDNKQAIVDISYDANGQVKELIVKG
ncbi:MAG: Gfo/Idh/MocA family oxidoreductase [Lentisphaeria bacterium]|nr:Gfo/Idh/MocA family oxidoreductase [Lentisphaeria bacterium]